MNPVYVLHVRDPSEPATEKEDAGIKALQGHNARRRPRVGDFRVVYTVEDGQLVVRVLSAGHRRDVHRNL
ncbi:type II toxin-antitoxin system RelE/ParE family toxin [Streptomyces sp. NPDC101455]|uniref:type II toxin-antitoxin system RelE family toxin n=1 Tax=Streptomyces sp. NPDC101455 TaxID=3366142 RepID=UPI003811757B